MILAGLRIDVDTLRGTRIGVPNILQLMAQFDIRGSFFFSVGPDNMGRHLRRLLRPAFLFKMLRTRAASLYGWDILIRGTLWPGPSIGVRCRETIRTAAAEGHEVGLHAWDHHRWQTYLDQWNEDIVTDEIRKGYDLLGDILGKAPECFAAPAWRVTPESLRALASFPFRYESDCRGHTIFKPVIEGRNLNRIQIPTTLPTYDECIGHSSTVKSYNNDLLEMFQPDRLNVLTIHSEVEGICCFDMFRDFLNKASKKEITFKPLGVLSDGIENIEVSEIRRSVIQGRDGWLACQEGSPISPSSVETVIQRD